MFSYYELGLLQDALVEYQASWEIEVERGGDVNPRFLKALQALGEKVERLLEEEGK